MDELPRNLREQTSASRLSREKRKQAEPEGRIAEINRAIEREEIDLARRLASGEDIPVPEFI